MEDVDEMVEEREEERVILKTSSVGMYALFIVQTVFCVNDAKTKVRRNGRK